MSKTIRLIVAVPEGCDEDDTIQYCLDALGGWGGQFHPEDPRFGGVQTTMAASPTHIYNLKTDKYNKVECISKTRKPKPTIRARIKKLVSS